MKYYSQYEHHDFILCLGYKASIIRSFFLDYRLQIFSDCVVSEGGSRVEFLGDSQEDWRVTLIDTGIWRSIGERLWAVRKHLVGEEVFFCNYSDGLTDLNLDAMTEWFNTTGKCACFLAVHPPLNFHFADIGTDSRVRALFSAERSEIWINGGYFIFRKEIFDYMREGEDLVHAPFDRLIKAGQLIAYKYEGFWRAMDTLRDRQVLEDMVERGEMPWRMPAVNAARDELPVAE